MISEIRIRKYELIQKISAKIVFNKWKFWYIVQEVPFNSFPIVEQREREWKRQQKWVLDQESTLGWNNLR